MEDQAKRFIQVAKEMRTLQKEFFSKNRKPSTLEASKAKERELDQLIEAFEASVKQPSLFEQDQNH